LLASEEQLARKDLIINEQLSQIKVMGYKVQE